MSDDIEEYKTTNYMYRYCPYCTVTNRLYGGNTTWCPEHYIDLDRKIELPEGVLWRDQETAPAYAIIKSHHLDAWCQDDEYYEE